VSAPLAHALVASLDEQALVDLAALLGPHLAPAAPVSPWLDVEEAATYLRCGRQRIYDLVSQGRLRCGKDGSRSLFRREWLDDYLAGEAA
jgi:excisionase family DNA binding protein